VANYYITTPQTATVTSVKDGDTLTLSDGRTIRLYGIDVPEHNQPYGREARDSNSLVYGKLVQVKAVNTDRYGRTVARIYVQKADVSLYQLQVGSAWHYISFDNSETYQAAEDEARAERIGLWSNLNPTPRESGEVESDNGMD
jgi:endonuclease YncB( thermonuclease family)